MLGYFPLVTSCLLILVIPSTDAINGGTVANLCDFPGIAVVTGLNNAIICSGVIGDGWTKLYMPSFCDSFISQVIQSTSLTVTNGFSKWAFTQTNVDKVVTTDKDGMAVMSLTGKVSVTNPETRCSETFATFYDGSGDLDTTSCRVAGWGSAVYAGATYTPGGLKYATITKSTGVSCCTIITNTYAPGEGGVALDYPSPNNCLTANASPCGVGDYGGPVVCDKIGGGKVTIALTSNANCKAGGGLFLAQDTTGSSDSKTKFGYGKQGNLVV